MSTPRKNWSKVQLEILRHAWPFHIKATFVLLQAAMVDRWRSDNLEALDAERIVLSKAALYEITGCENLKWSRRRLADLASTLTECRGELGSMSIEHRGDVTAIHWGNLAELQDLPSGRRAKADPQNVPSAPAPAPAPDEGSKNPLLFPLQVRPNAEASPPQRAKASKKNPGTQAPDQLGGASIQALERWAREHLPSELPHVRAHVDACLDHFRANGKPMVDWEATCRNWIRRAPEMRRNGKRAPIVTPAREQTPEELRETARRLRAVEYDRRLHGEI